MEAIFKRISVRKFEDKPVEQEKIDQLMKAAMAAPSAGNQQPWEFVIVTDKEKILALSKTHEFAMSAKNANTVIIPCYRKEEFHLVYPEYTHIDLSAACTNILLEAVNIGLGGVWLGVAPYEEAQKYVEEVVGIPEDLRAFCIMPIGYPAKLRDWKSRFDESRIHYVE
ncbi:MAG: nitroreductase family protein [Firmicutes bacterium]|nr:nitroreductase family protein [Bacillota bacterium]